GRERPARLDGELARTSQLLEDRPVARRPANRSAVREVLRSTAQHRRAADVDHLDGFLLPHAVAARDVAERIEVHADEVEGPDLVLLERRRVFVVVAPREDRCMDREVQRLHAASEHLRDAGQLLDPLDVETDLALEEVSGAAARYEPEPELRQPARELLQARLVVAGD